MNQQEVIHELISSLERNNYKEVNKIELYDGDRTASIQFQYASRKFDIKICTVKPVITPQFRIFISLRVGKESKPRPFVQQLINNISDIDLFVSTLNNTNSLEKIIEFYNCIEYYYESSGSKNTKVRARKSRLAIAFNGASAKIEIENQWHKLHKWQIHIIIYPTIHEDLHKPLLLKEDLTLKLLLIKEGLSIKWLNITHIPSEDGDMEFMIRVK